MDQQHYQTLFAFGWHTTANLLDKAAQLDDTSRNTDPGYGQGSIHDIFVHLLLALNSWRTTLETGQHPPPREAVGLDEVPALRQALEQEFAAWQALVGGLSDEQIVGSVTLTNARGHTYDMPYWRVFQQLVFHNMQHATELAQLLTAAGHSPGDIDFLFFKG